VPLDRLSITSEPFARISGAALSMAAPDDGTGRLFVGDQRGRVWIARADGTVRTTPLVDLRKRIVSGGEQGLLGIAVHPAFPIDPRVFVNFTDERGNSVIASLAIDRANGNRLDPATFTPLLIVDQPYANHNGGSLAFGPDGYLTIGLGDGGGGGDVQGNAQNLESLLGKILRIDVDGPAAAGPYAIPLENPYRAGGGRPEIWLTGLRNPWRTSYDRATGDFWIGDVGQEAWEEIDVVRSGTAGAVNFGWNEMEGAHCFKASTCDAEGLVPPVTEYEHDLGCAVVGGFAYRGTRYPFLVGTYLFSDNCSSRIFAIQASADGPVAPVQVGRLQGNVASLGEDVRGELYALTIQGTIARLVATID